MSVRVPTSAIVTATDVRPLDTSAEPGEEVTDGKLQQPGYTVRLFMRILRDVAGLRRRWAPRRLDYEDYPVGTGTYHRLPHDFGGRVRWWVVDAAGTTPELIRIDPDTLSDKSALVLYSGQATTCTIRIEEAG